MIENIPLEDLAALARPRDDGRVDAMVGGDFAAAGEAGIASEDSVAGASAGAGAGLAGAAGGGTGLASALGGAADAAASLIWPSKAPALTVSPSLATISARTPDAGALTSSVTLSVSSSTIGSSTLTGSPAFLNHRPTVASVTNFPKPAPGFQLPYVPPKAIRLSLECANRKEMPAFKPRKHRP